MNRTFRILIHHRNAENWELEMHNYDLITHHYFFASFCFDSPASNLIPTFILEFRITRSLNMYYHTVNRSGKPHNCDGDKHCH